MSAWGNAAKKQIAKELKAQGPAIKQTFPPAEIDWDHLVTLDFETYFDQDYTLRKLSTSQYIRDPRFYAHIVSIKIGDKPAEVVPHAKIAKRLKRINWAKHDLLCHHTQFDGFILQHHYGVIPRFYYCSLSMARGWFSNDIGSGLDEVAQYLKIGRKVPDVLNMMRGIKHLPPELYAKAAEYAAMDADLCLGIFKKLVQHFPQAELDLIDLTCQMFCCPVLRLDEPRAKAAMQKEIADRDALFLAVADSDTGIEDLTKKMLNDLRKEGIPNPTERDAKIKIAKTMLGSSDKFADLLRAEGVEPPKKVSMTWIKGDAEKRAAMEAEGKKYTYAFSKEDLAFTALAEEGDERVAALVEARLAVKSNQMITKAGRLIDSGKGGRPLPVYYKYAGAHTWRFGGGDSQNWQAFKRGGELRKSIKAPPGHLIATVDSSQIEPRVNAWLWGQEDMLDAFRNKRDLYSEFSTESIYNRLITKKDELERHVGKTSILGLGYGMGPEKFRHTLAKGASGPKVFVTLDFARSVVNAYRRKYFKIAQGWKICDRILSDMAAGRKGEHGVLKWEKERIWLPNGMPLKYPGLHRRVVESGDKRGDEEWVYKRKGQWVRIYGAALNENIVQALARIIVASFHMLKISKHYPVVMTTHDEASVITPVASGEKTLKHMLEIMSSTDDWFKDLPVAAEGAVAAHYPK